MTTDPQNTHDITPPLRTTLDTLYDLGQHIWEEFDRDVRQQNWHPFVNANYTTVERALLPFRSAGRRFLEWGSATGVITIMADLLGFEAYGIELDASLVDIACNLAERFKSHARFANGSFLPAGYTYRSPTGDSRLGTIGEGPSGYCALGRQLEDFDIVFGYPWSGEEPIMLDVMKQYGSRDAHLLLLTGRGIQVYRDGKLTRRR